MVLNKAFQPIYDWRRRELHEQIVESMKSQIDEAYRDRVASILAGLVRSDISLPSVNRALEQGPRLDILVKEFIPRCKELIKGIVPDKEPQEGALRVLKTLAKLTSAYIINVHIYCPAELQVRRETSVFLYCVPL